MTWEEYKDAKRKAELLCCEVTNIRCPICGAILLKRDNEFICAYCDFKEEDK